MTEPAPDPILSLRFLFDQHMSGPALRQLRARGIDVVHVGELGLAEADDADILHRSVREGRIIVTRNYCDFAPLAEAFARQRKPFPGVLFCPTSLRHDDAGGHVRALLGWIEDAVRLGRNPVENGLGWLAGQG